MLRVSKRGHLPTALGPTLPSPRRGDRQDRGGGGASGAVEVWEAAQCSTERQTERGGGGRAALWTVTHTVDGALVAMETAPSLERSLPIGWMMLGDVYCNTRLESRVY